MAGTRRRARISEAPARVLHLRSSSRASMTDEIGQPHGKATEAHHPQTEPVDQVHIQVQIDEVAESVDNASPRAVSPVRRPAKGFCKKCQGGVGDFFNSWHKITGSYYLPALVGSYSSTLREQGRQKAASVGSGLNGCVIQPLCCPRCNDTLGITVVDASDDKQSFRGRDFFKLPRIELRCEEAPNRFVAVEPQVDAAPDSLAVDLSPDPVIIPPAPAMEVDSRPPPPLSGPRQHHFDQHHDFHQPLQQLEANRQPLPPLRSPSSHALPQKSPSNPPLPVPSPAVKPVQDTHYSQPPSKESSTAAGSTRTRDLPPVVSHSHSHSQSPAEHRTNGQNYPRSPRDVQLDAIERLQTQISQNSSVLVAQSRDIRHHEESLQHQEDTLRREFQTQFHHSHAEIRRLDDAIGRLNVEMRSVRDLLDPLTREVHAMREMQARGVSGGPGQSVSAQDSALELMAQQVAVISHKANEVDTLKITIEIMKNKIQRLEDAAAAALPPQPSAHSYASPLEHPGHSTQAPQAVPSYHASPSVPHLNAPVHPAHRGQGHHSQGSQSVNATPEASQGVEPSQPQNGWATVNAGTKRTNPHGIDSPQESVGQSIGSPKRPKLAPIEPRAAYAGSQGHTQHVYEHMDTDDSDSARIQTHSHTLPSHPHSTGSAPESALVSQHSHAAFVPYGTQDAPSDDSWRPESQRFIEVRTPRGRGRGGGPGSRGGRVRKSMTSQVHPISTPEWERDDWHGVPESQISPDGYYSVARSGRGIMRRGSGGGGSTRGRPSSSSSRAVSLGLQGVTAGVGIGLPADPYAHTKKTRTKPIRNADGILIRKDGRPDMRSQSSAANLRKVHARKEEQVTGERGFTPTNLQHSTTVGSETPSPTGSVGQDLSVSQQKKHGHIMSKMFPGGVDESTKEHDYARKVFEEDKDHTAHPRAQHHHQHPHDAGTRPLQIKREQMERRLTDSQSPDDEDIDMDRPEDQADDEGATPGAQSDNSGHDSQYHDATTHKAQTAPQPNDESVPAPHSTVESSQTLAADSTQAA